MLSFPESNMIDYKVILCDHWRHDSLQRTPIIQEAENKSVETSGMNVKKLKIKLPERLFLFCCNILVIDVMWALFEYKLSLVSRLTSHYFVII